jgi:hypothetical protein
LPPEYETTFVESTRAYMDIQKAFREDPRLWRLSLEIYPELDPAGKALAGAPAETEAESGARRAAELRILLQMLQFTENAYLGLKLEVNYAHPLNRGWMDTFYRWTGAPTVRVHWPVVRGEFSRDFVRFCESQMQLGRVIGRCDPLQPDAPPEVLSQVLLEFQAEHGQRWREWLENQLKDVLASDRPSAWAVYPEGNYPVSAWTGGRPSAVGLIVVGPYQLPDVRVAARDHDHVLFVWLRGAYRNTGLGRSALRAVLRQLQKDWPRPFQLHVHLPTARLSGPGGQVQKAMWLTFFHHLDFVRVTGQARADDLETSLDLRRDFT